MRVNLLSNNLNEKINSVLELVDPNKYCIFAPLESATLPADQRTRAELFLSIRIMSYAKLPLDTPDIIHTLKVRGLAIADEKKAVEFLNHVSYFRFATYLRPMEEDAVTHRYKPTASFEKAVAHLVMNTFLASALVIIF